MPHHPRQYANKHFGYLAGIHEDIALLFWLLNVQAGCSYSARRSRWGRLPATVSPRCRLSDPTINLQAHLSGKGAPARQGPEGPSKRGRFASWKSKAALDPIVLAGGCSEPWSGFAARASAAAGFRFLVRSLDLTPKGRCSQASRQQLFVVRRAGPTSSQVQMIMSGNARLSAASAMKGCECSLGSGLPAGNDSNARVEGHDAEHAAE